MPRGVEEISVAITGSSGVVVGLRFVEQASRLARIKGVIVTSGALKVAAYEEGLSGDEFIGRLSRFAPVYMENDMRSPLASSSNQPDAMVIVPASMKTLGLIASGIASNLVARAALAMLRLRRTLVVAPRETPLGYAELSNMLKIVEMGGIVVPMTLGFYFKPRSIDDMVNFILGKIFDALGIDAGLYRRWGSGVEIEE